MDFLEQENISTYQELNKLIDKNGYIRTNIRIFGNEIKSLGKVQKIYGTLNLSGENIVEDLGDLNYVEGNFWAGQAEDWNETLTSLGKLFIVGGDLNLRYSNIVDLGDLEIVGNYLSLRDTPIETLAKLKHVKGDLALPKRLKDEIDLSSITIEGKVKYWNDFQRSKNYIAKKTLNWDVHTTFGTIHLEEISLNERKLKGKLLVQRIYQPSELNNYTLENIEDFFQFVESELDIIYGDKTSFYEVLFDSKTTLKKINNEIKGEKYDPPFAIYKGQKILQGTEETGKKSSMELKENIDKYPFSKYENKLQEYKKITKWEGVAKQLWIRYDENKLGFSSNSGEDESSSFKHYIENKIYQIFYMWIKYLEDEFRVSRGVPRKGEGWVSETDLYYKIKESLKPIEVIHHGRPKWLGRQHLDIWIPSIKIAVEYQGAQHYKPIDFFGGEEAFIEGQNRDERKKQLCKENNIKLIEVRDGYNLDEVLNQIKIKK